MVESEPYIGIDLGTTNSCMGLWLPETGTVEILANAVGKNTTPSWVAFETDGQVYVGESARNHKNWIYDAKRIIGRSFNDEKVTQYKDKWAFKVVKGKKERSEIKLVGLPRSISIEEVSAHVLKAMKRVAEVRCNRSITKAVVTVPAYFNETQRKATKDAATIAGLDCIRMINEPTAAAMATGFHLSDDEKNVLVFDWGGGTFDVSVLQISDGCIEVLATKGDMDLGGRDIDELLVDLCVEKFLEQTGIDL